MNYISFLFLGIPSGAPSLGHSETPSAAPLLATSKKPTGGENSFFLELSYITRKPVIGVRSQLRLKPDCSDDETG